MNFDRFHPDRDRDLDPVDHDAEQERLDRVGDDKRQLEIDREAVSVTDTPEVAGLKAEFRKLCEREEELKLLPETIAKVNLICDLRIKKRTIAYAVFEHEK